MFCYSEGIENDYINSSILSNLLPRVGDISNYKLIGYFLLLNEKFLMALSFFLFSFWLRKNNKIFSFVFIISAIYIFILFIIYLSTPYDFYWQLDSSAARVIRSISFLLAFFGIYNLKDYKKI